MRICVFKTYQPDNTLKDIRLELFSFRAKNSSIQWNFRESLNWHQPSAGRLIDVTVLHPSLPGRAREGRERPIRAAGHPPNYR